ncbi:hypothetical protein PTSG_11228 [Salpingoeca rosetta]|uniref:NmrA-like domain-containing protein n=1 Tax=Salpingoeca rosetta (strain ATCC 50818 / BSB-021) TaxID=946362 RepID=F2UST3_SALR5|nr:uncharacterized protein PTSG_11228 [Salpingoeca rosetta]EGD81192.1 hypothetical protein PTSG_11228 [Salpingoeca rosetta]|eukprot:XP_004987727.1 hypothetical protein PTSG_11228 [Salpingoeca rosetta]
MAAVVSVITATSNSGSACVEELLRLIHNPKHGEQKHAVQVRACVRSEKQKRDLLQHGYQQSPSAVTVTAGVDALAPNTLPPAFEGASVAVIVTPMTPQGFDKDAQATANMVNAAVTAGVKHIVYVGSWTVHQPARLSLLAARFAPTEQLLHKLADDVGITWTSLRSGYFFNNFVHVLGPALKQHATTPITVRFPAITVPACDPRDIGRVAAHVAMDHATSRQDHHARCYDISGPELLPMREVVRRVEAAVLPLPGASDASHAGDASDASHAGDDADQPSSTASATTPATTATTETTRGALRLAYEPVPAAALKGVVPEYLHQLLVYLEEEGEHAVPLSRDVETVTGQPPVSLDTWLRTRAAAPLHDALHSATGHVEQKHNNDDAQTDTNNNDDDNDGVDDDVL